MFENMLQLMPFSVYFKGVLNTSNGYFHIKIIISTAHILLGMWAYVPRKFFEKKCSLVRFDVFLHTLAIGGGGADQFPRMLYAAPLRSTS